MRKLSIKILRNQSFCFLLKTTLSFSVSFFLKLFKVLTVFRENRVIFLKSHLKKLFRFFLKIGVSLKSFEFSENRNLISKITKNQLFRFLKKKLISFVILFFLTFFRLTGKINKNRVIFFGNDFKKLFGFL